jgi:hypothetical protein
VRDIDVRRALHTRLLRVHPPRSQTLFVDEFDLTGAARVDVAVINGVLSAYEIKSERDTLRRLPGQIAAYSRVFDFVTIVVAGKHCVHALDSVPAWWSVISAHAIPGDVVLVDERDGSANDSVDPEALAWLLWRDELLAELAARDLLGGVRSKPRRVLCDRLASAVPLDEVRRAVRDRLKARENWRVPR